MSKSEEKKLFLTNGGADSAHGNNLVILEAEAGGKGDGGGCEDNEGLHDKAERTELTTEDTTMALYLSGVHRCAHIVLQNLINLYLLEKVMRV